MKVRFMCSLFCVVIALQSGLVVGESEIPARAMEFDAVIADAEHHKILYEDDHIRIFELITVPGDVEPMHTHPYPAVSVYDTVQGAFKTVDAEGNRMTFGRNLELLESDPPFPPEVVEAINENHRKLEAALKAGEVYSSPMPPRYVPTELTSTDTIGMHSYRIEFKRVGGGPSATTDK